MFVVELILSDGTKQATRKQKRKLDLAMDKQQTYLRLQNESVSLHFLAALDRGKRVDLHVCEFKRENWLGCVEGSVEGEAEIQHDTILLFGFTRYDNGDECAFVCVFRFVSVKWQALDVEMCRPAGCKRFCTAEKRSNQV